MNPSFTSQYSSDEVASNSVIAVSDKRSKVIPYSDLYESSVNYQTYSMETTGFDGEGQITSAIAYVTTDDLPVLYTCRDMKKAHSILPCSLRSQKKTSRSRS